jgi:hypothetical protein
MCIKNARKNSRSKNKYRKGGEVDAGGRAGGEQLGRRRGRIDAVAREAESLPQRLKTYRVGREIAGQPHTMTISRFTR